ncbi:MAG TPA: hypothetical protein VK928_04015 [Longimicrobiales bacterium]|nr:hypothetical protein [Longimicrobiales bacterium]
MERPPAAGGRIASLGQPQRIHWQAGLGGGSFLDRDPIKQLTFQSYIGASRHLFNPVAGLGTIGVEVFAGVRAAAVDAGGRAILRIPYVGMGAGVEYNPFAGSADVLITAYGPVRRGGIVVPGGALRVDAYPWKRGFTIGLSIPLGDPLAGRGRPLRDHVVVGADFEPSVEYRVEDAQLEAALDSIGRSAEWIRRLVVPFLDQDGRDAGVAERRTAAYVEELRAHLALRSTEEEVRHFHGQLEHAFTLAAGSSDAGRELAHHARGILLDEMLLPYNRLLGRKKRKDTLDDLATAARGRFSRWVTSSDVVAGERIDPVLFVFQRITQQMDDVRHSAAREWNDMRLVWLPLQYALLPEDHDEQHELDELLARATGALFTPQNDIRYVANLQFHWELLRSIRDTEDYHVLWVHDFPAVTQDDSLDWASRSQVVDGYLNALADHVENYDRTGRLPEFFIFVDEFYYQSRRSRVLMTILQDPLRATAELPRGVHGDTELLMRALERLRAAVLGSRVLRAEARQYGDAWLRNRIKVHINVTNRADPSFWSGSLIGTLFGYPDNVMRDHRKVAFHDVSEADPRRGRAIFTGMGVGQQYLGPGWEDRSLMVQGPVLLGLKTAARELLLSQGLPQTDLPGALRAAAPADAAAYGPRPASDNDWSSNAMLLVNGTGYLAKPINVAKALLYSLMPPGSVIKVPDSLWNSSFFGGLLAGASVRGCTVTITAPALANAPSDGFPQMARAHELLTRLLMMSRVLETALGESGGELQVLLYALEPHDNGFAGRADAWVRQAASYAHTRARLPARVGLAPVVAAAAAAPAAMTSAQDPGAPKLHQKVQYLATREMWDALATSQEWPAFMATYIQYREATHVIEETEAADAHGYPRQLALIARRVFGPAEDSPRAATFAIVGSQNMDYRGMLMDGEVGVLFTGFASVVPLLDLLFLEGTATPVTDQHTLDRLLPRPTELQRRLGRLIKDAL